jgi:hypothetical protein
LRELGKPRTPRIVVFGEPQAKPVAAGVETVPRPNDPAGITTLVARLVHEYHQSQVPERQRLEGDLNKRLLAALSAFFETYTGSAPELDSDGANYDALWAGGTVNVTADDESFQFRLWLAGERAGLEAVAQAMFDEGDDSEDADALVQVVGELLNSAAGAAKTIAENGRIAVKVGIPEVDEAARKPPLGDGARPLGSLNWKGTGGWTLWMASRDGMWA